MFPVEELQATVDQGFVKIDQTSQQLESWWSGLTPVEQNNPVNEAKYTTANRALDTAGNILNSADAALNDDRGEYPDVSGKGRGYLNSSIKWLFAQNLELEVLIKDILVNRREASTVTREVRMMYIDHF